ncbi:hypothetical protein MOUSESFB_0241 [Candidatus Arthromitus sp. SFB-mouse-Yit]|nr:hypothetical protein MOUSESFB_0241 [Candidatus Arthromitus sp. SFB-mouse-Yit]
MPLYKTSKRLLTISNDLDNLLSKVCCNFSSTVLRIISSFFSVDEIKLFCVLVIFLSCFSRDIDIFSKDFDNSSLFILDSKRVCFLRESKDVFKFILVSFRRFVIKSMIDIICVLISSLKFFSYDVRALFNLVFMLFSECSVFIM